MTLLTPENVIKEQYHAAHCPDCEVTWRADLEGILCWSCGKEGYSGFLTRASRNLS